MNQLLNNNDEVFLSLFTLLFFYSFYGRSSFIPILKEIFKVEASNREKAYLFCAFIEEIIENPESQDVQSLIQLLPNSGDINESEVIAIEPYIEGTKTKLNSSKIKKTVAE